MIISVTQAPPRLKSDQHHHTCKQQRVRKSEITQVSSGFPFPPPLCRNQLFQNNHYQVQRYFYHSCLQNCLIVSSRHRHQDPQNIPFPSGLSAILRCSICEHYVQPSHSPTTFKYDQIVKKLVITFTVF